MGKIIITVVFSCLATREAVLHLMEVPITIILSAMGGRRSISNRKTITITWGVSRASTVLLPMVLISKMRSGDSCLIMVELAEVEVDVIAASTTGFRNLMGTFMSIKPHWSTF